jgi:hypothetical protein
MIDHDAPAALDETDLALITALQNEFVFTGAGSDESDLMSNALRGKLSLHEGIAELTGQMRSRLRIDAIILGLSPELLGSHHVLVLPDYRFGASSRVYEGRHYILFNAGCMNLFSYLAEISILFGRLMQAPGSVASRELETWLMADAHELALAYLHRPFALPLLRRYFDDDMTMAESSLLATVELFVYFHEAGHIELGHLGSGFGESEQERSLPDGAEEFAADRFALEKVLTSSPGQPIGAYILEELFVLELHGYRSQEGTVSYRDRLAALIQAFPDNFLHRELPDPVSGATMPWERPGFDVRKARRKLYWTCDQVALLLGIDVQEEKEPAEPFMKRGADMIEKSLRHHSDEELTNTMLALIKAGGDLDKLRAFIRENPVVLSNDADAWLEVAIEQEQAGGARALLGAKRVYLERCRETGVEGIDEVLPVKFALQALMDASSLEDRFDILRAQPHLLTNEGTDYIAMHCDEFKTNGDARIAGRLQSIIGLINHSRELGLEACLEHRRNLPLLPDQVWQMVHALDTAMHNGDVMQQIRICNEAIALADQEAGIPTWSLAFRERLQQLPQF